MAQPQIQTSFHSGEWAPALNARVDLAKYHSAVALGENFYVDYRGGLSTRPGTRYIIQCADSANVVRLIPFQASFSVGYALEFGNNYIRFIYNGAPVLAVAQAIVLTYQSNPCRIDTVHTFALNDVVYITNVGGMTQLNGRYYKVIGGVSGTYMLLGDLNGANIDSSTYTPYTSGGTVANVYQIASPYASADLATLKYAQNVDVMVLTHPNYASYLLTLITAANWTLNKISFGTTISPPIAVSLSTTLGNGSANYSYVVTSVDGSGQESVPSSAGILGALQDIRTVAGSIFVGWTSATNAVSYNIYRAEVAYAIPVPVGAAYGYIGNATGSIFTDSNIAPDFSLTPPIAQNPFVGSGVVSYTVGTPGTYTVVPNVTVAASGGVSFATANATLGVTGTPTISAAGSGYAANDTITLSNGVVVVVATTGGGGAVATYKAITVAPSNPGSISVGGTPVNPVVQVSTSGGGTGATVNLTWGVSTVYPVSSGAGYATPPAVSFSPAGAAATAVLGASTALNPSVPGYFQQRLVLAGLSGTPQTFYLSQPGNYYNYNVSNPIQADDAISSSIVSGQLNTIKSMVAVPAGLMLLSDKAAWLVNSGAATSGAAVTPADIVANPHSYNGVSDVPPIVANFDILYVQAKGSIVRDLSYNIYANVFTGTDISVLSSHLFYGYQILEWAWAEEPFKVVWAIRNDGVMLTLTFLKEQELIGWTHSNTSGLFKSVCTVTESTSFGNVDAVYTVVERVINGNTVKYIERFSERAFPNGATSAWCVDSGLQYSGAPATSFTGAENLAGATVTGLADGVVIPPFVMPLTGFFTIGTPASVVTVGLAYLPKFQTLALEMGEPTVQGKRKKITAVDVRVADTLGLSIGSTFSNQVPMKDLVIGNVGSQSNAVVAGLVTGDARTVVDPKWTVDGQYCITQPLPYPATILGVIPEIVVGDTAK